MAFPTIPTTGNGRLVFVNQLNTTATRTFPAFSGLTFSAGDRLVAIVIGYQSSTTNAQFSGWSHSFNERHDSGTSSTLAVGIAEKIADGTESGSLTVTQAATITGDASMILMAIPGAHASTAIELSGRVSGTTAEADPAALAPSWGAEDTLFISVVGSGMTNATGTWTATGTVAPTNYTDRVDTNAADTSTIGDAEAAVAFRQINTSSEDVGIAGVDVSNARNAAIVIAVRPAAITSFDGTAAADLAFTASGTGDYAPAVFNGTGSATLAITADAVWEVYRVFRRTPQTGAVFDPDSTPLAKVTTNAYTDVAPAEADYDYQVFRWDASIDDWSTGSEVAQITVDTGADGQGSASLAFTASGTGNYEPAVYNGQGSAALAFTASAVGFVEYAGQGSAALAFTATGAGDFAPAGFNGQGSASLVFTATGTGDYAPAVYNATAAGALVFTASGAGNFAPAGFNGQGSAALAFTATGNGFVEYAGQGSAALAFTATGSGFAVSNATGSANLVFTASGQGDAGVPTWSGQGSASLVVTATGTGDHVPPEFNGQGSGNLVFTASGVGNFAPAGFNGQGSATLVVTATGTGNHVPPSVNGQGSANLVFTASAVGHTFYAGSGSALLVFTATGTGTEGELPAWRVESGVGVSSLVDVGSGVTILDAGH